MAGRYHTQKLDSVISSIDDLENSDAYAATSKLQQRAGEVRQNRVNWASYFQGQMISQEEYSVIKQIDNVKPEDRETFIKENSLQVAKVCIGLIGHLAKDQTLQYTLTLIDDILQEDKSRVEMFKSYARSQKESIYGVFLHMLSRPDGFICNQTSRIIAKMACWSKEAMEGKDLVYYVTWLKEQLKHHNNEYLQSVCRCLQMMLRIDTYRFTFLEVEGITTITSVLAGKVGFQIQYQLIFCLWCMTFNEELCEKLNSFNIIPILADILSESAKEKVTRIILAAFKNLLSKPTDKNVIADNALTMVQCKVLKQLQLLDDRKFDDPDIVEDIEFLNETLLNSVQDLSSFDEYCSEVRSGRLEWSPVHREERFWRENAGRFNEKNYELLKILIKLLDSHDPLILSVAAHDIGEYVRHYPRGKHVIEQLGGKELVMKHLSHGDPNVRYEALLSVQKLMVHNWEYLGKQLETKDSKVDAPEL